MKDNPGFVPLTKEAFLNAVSRRKLITRGDRIVAAVSGGCDSSALLHLLFLVREEMNLTVVCAHVNHNLRGAEAERDSDYVRATCERYGIPFRLLSADVSGYASEHHMSIEDTGRKIRYDFFQSLADEIGGGKIATAHTLSDRAETYIFNSARGSSISGICGIPAERDNIIRPLIDFTRDQTEDYCWQNDIDYVTDSTNLEDDYVRNKIRHHIIPVMKEINPSFEKAMSRLLSSLDSIKDFIDSTASLLMETALVSEGVYDASVFSGAPDFIRNEVAATILKSYGFEVTNDRSLALAEAFTSDSDYKAELSKDAYIVKSDGLVFKKTARQVSDGIEPVPLKPGTTETSIGRKYTMTVMPADEFQNLHNIKKISLRQTYDADKIVGVPVIRSRVPGDRASIHGGTKTLKKLFNEEKIPAEYRSETAVVSDDIGIVWIEGLGSDLRCRVTEKTKNVAVIETASK